MLLSGGGHLDRVNIRGNSALNLTSAPLYTLQHVTLQCLAARNIKLNDIPYTGKIPQAMEEFVSWH